jgi:hypothetical protein
MFQGVSLGGATFVPLQTRMMRRFKLLLILVCLGGSAAAQYNNPFSSGRDRLTMLFNWNTWLNNSDSTLKLQAQSRGFEAYWMFDLLFAEKSRFSVAPGLGISTTNVFHKSKISVDSTGTMFTPYPDSVTVSKNKLATTHVEVPLELRYRSKPNKSGNSWKIAAGVKIGLLMSVKTKYVGEGSPFGVETEEAKIKMFRVPNINQLRYGATFRVGYGNFNVVAFYALSPLFAPNLGPTLNPFSVGVSFNFL